YGVNRYVYDSTKPVPTRAWTQLTATNTSLLAVTTNGAVYGDFKGYGLQLFLGAMSWQSLGTADATSLAVNSSGYVAANLDHSGVSLYTAAAGWQSLKTSNVSLLTVDVNGNVVVDFPGYGVQIGNLSGFRYLGARTGDASLLATSQG
ncbi:MAG TPA: hypothetical protein VHV77_09235, partial [Pirellulales bacterium]|nr:hypothetical protein [Pirellulales bacterium]